jgi:hypothetical protein
MRKNLDFSICEAYRSRPRLRCWGLALPAAMLLTLSLGAPSRGGSLDLILENFQATSSTTGSFEVDLVNNYGTSVTVSDFSIELRLSGLAGVVFTGASTNTTAFPYIFSGVGGPPPFSGSTFPTTDLVAGDSVFTAPFTVTLPSSGTGSEVGLALVTYDTSAALPGTAFIGIGPGTSVSDSVTNPQQSVDYQLDYSTPAGQIVVGGTVVPEPSTVVLLATALPCVAGVFFRARTAIRNRSAGAKSQP